MVKKLNVELRHLSAFSSVVFLTSTWKNVTQKFAYLINSSFRTFYVFGCHNTELTSIARDDKQGDQFLFCGPTQKSTFGTPNCSQKSGERAGNK